MRRIALLPPPINAMTSGSDKLPPDKADNMANRTGLLEMIPRMSALGH